VLNKVGWRKMRPIRAVSGWEGRLCTGEGTVEQHDARAVKTLASRNTEGGRKRGGHRIPFIVLAVAGSKLLQKSGGRARGPRRNGRVFRNWVI